MRVRPADWPAPGQAASNAHVDAAANQLSYAVASPVIPADDGHLGRAASQAATAL